MDQKQVKELVELAKKGDSFAFGTLIESHERLVYNIVYKMIPNTEDAKDISQEVFIKAFRYLDKFDGKSAFSTWLYRIAVNTSIDEIRKRKGKETVSMDSELDMGENSIQGQFADTAPSVEEQVIEKESVQGILESMNKLSEEHKAIITLRDLEGLSYTEIAEITKTSMGTVKSRLARARKTLKEIIVEQRNKDRKISLNK